DPGAVVVKNGGVRLGLNRRVEQADRRTGNRSAPSLNHPWPCRPQHERGASAHQLMVIFGWRTIKQAEVYTRAAERKRLAGAAIHLLGKDGGQESLTSDKQPFPGREKEAKS